MLCALKVDNGAINFHVRCHHCHTVITDYPQQKHCLRCGKVCMRMPLI